jgi:hypothetical protein
MNNYGSFSEYDYLSKDCKCMSNYQFNSSGTKCISKDQACQNQLGIMSRYDSLYSTCDCLSGYEIINGQCSLKPIPVRNIIAPHIPSNTPTLTPMPIFKNVFIKSTPTPKIFKNSPTPTIDINASRSGETALPTTTSNSHNNQNFLTRIISFIARLFAR